MANEIWETGRENFTTALASDTIKNWLEDKPTTRAYLEGIKARLDEYDNEHDHKEARGAAYELARAVRGELFKDASFIWIEDAARKYLGIED